jgi:hypothetical protein
MSILIGSTIPPYKTSPGDGATRWLSNGEKLRYEAAGIDVGVDFFAALETDARGIEPFADLLDILAGLAGDYWSFSLDTRADEITGNERLIRICTGRNLIREYAMRHGYEWVLYLDSDMRAPDDALPKLLELDYPVVGAEVPVYCQSGAPVKAWPTLTDRYAFTSEGGPPVREKCDVDTAGLLLVHRSVFSKVAWRYDGDAGMTDDPAYFHDAELNGWPLLVRTDVVGEHEPLTSLEHRGHDLSVHR